MTVAELASGKDTPMMLQWKECKQQAQDAILFFRLGDFYEVFHEDAKVAAQILDLTLTQRQEVPMCGIPWHASDSYIERLVQKGFKIAIAEQVEDPKKTKGLVARKVVRVISPATLVAASPSDEKGYSFIGAISQRDSIYGLALLDISTACFWVYEFTNTRDLINEIFRQQPKELLLSKRFQAKENKMVAELAQNHQMLITAHEEWLFDPVYATEALCHHFTVKTLDGFGLKEMIPAISSAGALLQYVKDWLLCPLDHVKKISPNQATRTMQLDRQTLVNLEIVEAQGSSQAKKSLLSLLDETSTPMGARLLCQWVKSPLVDLELIEQRQKAVAAFVDSHLSLNDQLEQIRDLEKILFRIKNNSSGPREYVALKNSLIPLVSIKQALSIIDSTLIASLNNQIDPCTPCLELIQNALSDTPPFRVSDGGLFKEGYSSDLDELVALRKNSNEWLLNYQARLREETGIKTIKVGYTRMFGYYIEVSRGQVDKMPDSFQRRQTLVNGERYITPELKEFEEKILSADAKIEELEGALFAALRSDVILWHDAILQTAQAISTIDILYGFSLLAKKRGYVCPKMNTERMLSIKDGRHPIIEAMTKEPFVPNDTHLDGVDAALMCLTGPNMAGKSTYIRQTALLVIMAHMGSFIPAKEATIGIVDKVFSRIGASDDLARGQSTFMVEMAETASILHQATDKSLIILDEIGRGTSTYDGISLAWAVAEFLVTQANPRPKTLFATHYFELTELKEKLPGVINSTVAICETADAIVFLRKIIEGTTDRSYGIHVARLAGMPAAVITRAESILTELEAKKPALQQKTEVKNIKCFQDDLFANSEEIKRQKTARKIIEELVSINIDHTTPFEALARIFEWQKSVK
jgi:DNA mismatch repair protein MutS